MPNINVLSLIAKKVVANVKFFKSRSKVTVKVTCTKFIVLSEVLAIKNTHTKYESPIS